MAFFGVVQGRIKQKTLQMRSFTGFRTSMGKYSVGDTGSEPISIINYKSIAYKESQYPGSYLGNQTY